MRVLDKFLAGEEMIVSIPPGDYFVGDPCYFLNDDLYYERHNIVFPADGKGGHDCYNVLLEVDGCGVMLNWNTMCGDGVFGFITGLKKSRSPGLGIAVDSGQIAIIDKRIVEKYGDIDASVSHYGEMTLDEPMLVVISEYGNLNDEVNDMLNVIVDPGEYCDDFDDEDEDDDE